MSQPAGPSTLRAAARALARLLALLLLSALALQVVFAGRVALMRGVDPQSTTFQRSEAWRLLAQRHSTGWSQQWVGYARISEHLKRAVIASEDAGFGEHSGVEWDALEKAWDRNQKADKEKAEKAGVQRAAAARAAGKLVGGSTITQQLAKNLFLDAERNWLRKVPAQATQLAVLLPAPKRFEKRPHSPYVASRAATVGARMGAVEPP